MNKNKTQSEYIRRINKAQAYIGKYLDQNLLLEDVARASHFSPYHFHRIYSAIVGETVNDYISRKRMEKAVSRLLKKPELSVTEVAELGGFSSSANFAKAFKLYFGVSATELRAGELRDDADTNSKIGKIFSKYGKAFNPQDLYSQFITDRAVFDPNKLEELLMKIKVESMQEKLIAYLTAPNGYELNSVYDTWDKIIHWANSIGVDDPQRFAICHDNPVITPENKCRYDASLVITSDVKVKAPYNQSVIPSGKYAIAYFKDDGDKISPFMTEICSHWFPDSGFEPDDYPVVFHYLNDSREDGYVEMEVYIKVKDLEFS